MKRTHFFRFIPTRVGNTENPPPIAVLSAVHPHACGEYADRADCQSASGGSSPRVWGIHLWEHRKLPYDRFIPTRVGNTGIPQKWGIIYKVHPHACGEYVDFVFNIGVENGSSPRVWGIHSECIR